MRAGFSSSRRGLALLLIVSAGAAFGGEVAQGTVRRASLETPSAALGGGATYQASGYAGPLRLPPTGTPSISYGFTIPDDFRSGPLPLEVQVGSPSASCKVVLRARHRYRARSGRARRWSRAPRSE